MDSPSATTAMHPHPPDGLETRAAQQQVVLISVKRTFCFGVWLAAVLWSLSSPGAAWQQILLPTLRINGQPARAHTQGMEIQDDNYFVTARREDQKPRQALLLCCAKAGVTWDVWDLTPQDERGELTALDHPGGFQSDGARLWIPLAESKRNGRSLVRAYRIASLKPGQKPQAEVEFAVNDHIGALAVSTQQMLLFGASWDTAAVYVWDFSGRLKQKLEGADLAIRGLNSRADQVPPLGLAVQDWKVRDNRLWSSGLRRSSTSPDASPLSGLLVFTRFTEVEFQCQIVTLPQQRGVEPAREAMTIHADRIYFLPEDLGATNRLFCAPLADLLTMPADPRPASQVR